MRPFLYISFSVETRSPSLTEIQYISFSVSCLLPWHGSHTEEGGVPWTSLNPPSLSLSAESVFQFSHNERPFIIGKDKDFSFKNGCD